MNNTHNLSRTACKAILAVVIIYSVPVLAQESEEPEVPEMGFFRHQHRSG